MFGEINPDASFVYNFIGTVGLIATIITALRTAAGKNEAQKRLVTFAEEFARREDLERLEEHVEKVEEKLEHALEGLRCEMKEDRELIMRAGEERAAKIHDRINVVLGGVERLAGRMDK